MVPVHWVPSGSGQTLQGNFECCGVGWGGGREGHALKIPATLYDARASSLCVDWIDRRSHIWSQRLGALEPFGIVRSALGIAVNELSNYEGAQARSEVRGKV